MPTCKVHAFRLFALPHSLVFSVCISTLCEAASLAINFKFYDSLNPGHKAGRDVETKNEAVPAPHHQLIAAAASSRPSRLLREQKHQYRSAARSASRIHDLNTLGRSARLLLQDFEDPQPPPRHPVAPDFDGVDTYMTQYRSMYGDVLRPYAGEIFNGYGHEYGADYEKVG